MGCVLGLRWANSNGVAHPKAPWGRISLHARRHTSTLALVIDCHTREQNGLVERVIRTLKEQCAYRYRFETLQHASRVIGDWIGFFYNHRRPHQALGMKTPAATYALAA